MATANSVVSTDTPALRQLFSKQDLGIVRTTSLILKSLSPDGASESVDAAAEEDGIVAVINRLK